MSEKDFKQDFDRLAEGIAGEDKAKKSKLSRIWNSLKELKSEIGEIKKQQNEMMANNKRHSEETRARIQETQKRNDEFYLEMLGEARTQNSELERIVAAVKKS